MKHMFITLSTILLLLFLTIPVFATDYVNPPDHETPDPIVDESTKTNDNNSPNTTDGNELPLAIGMFVLAMVAIGSVKQKKA